MKNMGDFKIVKGRNNGKNVLILGGVHGDELPGIWAIENVLPKINIKNGLITYGIANPRAVKIHKRFTEENLNRMFYDKNAIDKNSYEYKRAQELKKIMNKHDILLDLHSSSIKDTPAFAICEPNSYNIVKSLPVEYIVSGFDEHEPGGTDYYMNKIGKIGICIECGYHSNKESKKIAEQSIYNLLTHLNMINDIMTRSTQTSNYKNKQKYYKVFYKHFAKTNTFKLKKYFKNFENLRKNELIGYDGITEVRAQKDAIILFAHNGSKIGDEVFLLAEKK